MSKSECCIHVHVGLIFPWFFYHVGHVLVWDGCILMGENCSKYNSIYVR